jgi:hypothetical protein
MKYLSAIALAFLIPALASANPIRPVEIDRQGMNLQHAGSGSVGFLFWQFFDADLWATNGRFSWDQPLALSLTYRTDFSARELTDSTIEEMARINGWPKDRLSGFRSEIAPCMSDVSDGDRFTAASPAPDRIVLFLNGDERCDLSMPGLRRAYLNIWLSENSRFPDQSRRLTGGSP